MTKTKWSTKSMEPFRTDAERDQLFSKHCNQHRDYAKHFVGQFTKKWVYALKVMDFDDWCQVARMALLKAAACWDESEGTEFSTYAMATMHRCCHDELITNGIIRLPKYSIKKRRYEKEADAARMVSQLDLHYHRERPQDYKLPVNQLIEQEKKQRIAEAIQALPERLRIVFTNRYSKGMSLRESGKEFGISKEASRQIINKVIKMIRLVVGIEETNASY